jgi:hypothetical protein
MLTAGNLEPSNKNDRLLTAGSYELSNLKKCKQRSGNSPKAGP